MTSVRTAALVAALALCAGFAAANDLEGRIDAVNAEQRSFVVQGITFFVTENTDFDRGLRGFVDLRAGMVVEVDFEYRDGRHVAIEIELER